MTNNEPRKNMRLATPFLGLSVACAACCALPLALPLLTGLGLGSLFDWRIGVVVAAVAFGTIALVKGWRRPAQACAPAGTGCGCRGARIAPRVEGRDGPQEDA